MYKRKIGLLLTLVLSIGLLHAGLYAQRSLQDKTSSWSAGLMAGFYSRGIKYDSQLINMSAPAGLLIFRGKNLGGTVDLTLYAGYGSSNLNGVLFDRLPISLDYQAGGISGTMLGLKADWPVFYTGNYTIGMVADFISFLGFKRKFNLEDFSETAEARVNPAWNQATGGIYLLYDGLGKIEPYITAGVSFFWGTFKATENIGDLTGTESKKLKGAGIISLTLGANFKLTESLLLVPQFSFYPAGKSALSAGLGVLYSF